MKFKIKTKEIDTIADLINEVKNFKPMKSENPLYFRGESEDFKENALKPSIYRSEALLENEHIIYREMQRFNEHEFISDKTAFDKLSRMQHYGAPTRLLDLSEDVLSALYFALEERAKSKKAESQCVLYIIEINREAIKYYDSDAVSVVANLAKLPFSNIGAGKKSKVAIEKNGSKFLNNIDAFNKTKSAKYLLHEIREEKSYFLGKINPEHLFSVLLVKPKLTNNRLHGQKGSFLIYGLNQFDAAKSLQVVEYHKSRPYLSARFKSRAPFAKIRKLLISQKIQYSDLKKLGVTTPFIYPEMDKVADYLLRPV